MLYIIKLWENGYYFKQLSLKLNKYNSIIH